MTEWRVQSVRIRGDVTDSLNSSVTKSCPNLSFTVGLGVSKLINVRYWDYHSISSILLHLTASANLSGWRIFLREDPQCCWNLDTCKKLKTKIQDVATMSNSLNLTLFSKYSDILQPLQISQAGEYPCVKIHNVVGGKIPVKKLKTKVQDVATRLIFLWLFLEVVVKIVVSGV